jgi:phosphate transport system substrate-binding protein
LSLALATTMLAGCPAEKEAVVTAPDATKVVIRGSNTIGEELAPHLITVFKQDHPGVAFEVETKATGYGLAALRAGKCDIAAASRSADKEEIAEAEVMHCKLTDHVIGTYGVAVVVNPGNPVTSLTKEQVRDIFTGVITNWSAVGGADSPIHLYARDPISGTYLGFKELAMENKAYALNVKLADSYENDAQAVAQDAAGIGYTGIEVPKSAQVKAITIGGVAATAANVNNSTYPYTRTLHLYTREDRESTTVKDFVTFVLSPKGQDVLVELGFVPHG